MSYVRKTRDVYLIMGKYSNDWDEVCEENTFKEARVQLKCYNENEPYPHKIVKKRVRLEEGLV